MYLSRELVILQQENSKKFLTISRIKLKHHHIHHISNIKVSPAFHSKFLTTTRWWLTLTMTIIYQKKDSFKFSFFFSPFFLEQIPSHIFHSRSAPNFIFLFGRWLSNNYQFFIYRPRGAVQRIKPDSRPLDARRGCPLPLPSTDNWMRCKSRHTDKTGTSAPRKRINGQKWPVYPTPGGWGKRGKKEKKGKKEGERKIWSLAAP